jgi:hypothetical protein
VDVERAHLVNGRAGLPVPNGAGAREGLPAFRERKSTMGTTKKAQKAKPESNARAASAPAAAKADVAKAGNDKDKGGKRKLGLRGAAPWAARHAAKHAAEARARAAEPPLPGSARATIRVPTGAEDIKAKIGDLHNSLVQIKALRKNLGKSFYDIGHILHDIQLRRLYEAKGYGTFEAFLEREIDLGKMTALRLVRVSTTFLKEAALDFGMDRVLGALGALEQPADSNSHIPKPAASAGKIPDPPSSTTSLPLRPPGR